jgi:hypothetical protein
MLHQLQNTYFNFSWEGKLPRRWTILLVASLNATVWSLLYFLLSNMEIPNLPAPDMGTEKPTIANAG